MLIDESALRVLTGCIAEGPHAAYLSSLLDQAC